MHFGRTRSTRTCGEHAGDPGTSPGLGHALLIRPAGEDRVRTGAAVYSPQSAAQVFPLHDRRYPRLVDGCLYAASPIVSGIVLQLCCRAGPRTTPPA